MSLRASIDGPLHPNPHMPAFRETPQVVSLSEPNLFLQGDILVEKASTCATSMISGFVASVVTKNPLPLLMGFCGCLPQTFAQRKIGNEFQVNTYTNNSQTYPSVTSLSNGNFVVVWTSVNQDGSGDGIFGQLFNKNTSRLGNEFQANTYTPSQQSYPSITTLSNGNFVVTWSSRNQEGSFKYYGVYGQIFTENTSKIGSEFHVNTYTSDNEHFSSITGLNNGNFVVTWTRSPIGSIEDEVFGQLFNEQANKIGNEFQVNTYTSSSQGGSSVTNLNNDNFVVTWSSRYQEGSNEATGVYGQLFDENANKIGNEFHVNTYINNHQFSCSVTVLSSGNFVVIWVSEGQDSSGFGIYGQLFDESGRKIGGEFQVNTYTNLDQENPSVTSLSNGKFVVTWTSQSQDGSQKGIFGQIFSGNASKFGNEFLVNTFTFYNQFHPSVTNLSNDTFIVTWQSNGKDGLGSEIFGQIFNDKIIITSTTTTSTTSTTTTSTTSTTTLPTSTRFTNPTSSSALSSPNTSTNLEASSPKSSKLITGISLGLGGLICFCVAPLGFLLFRKRKSQSDARLSEETGIRNTAFELDPVMERAHVVIGRTYYLLNTLTQTEAEEIFLQTGHLTPFPETQREFFYVIGSGQFGEIKVAKRIKDGEYVASKEVKGEENMLASEAEAEMQKEAAGENVLPIYNTIRLEDALYHFMPLAGLGDGMAVQRQLALSNQSPLALTILTFIAQNILTGLQTIHTKGIYHLDIKPDNLVFTKDGTTYITDFGCAQRPESRHLTGEALGDNRYFSPERLKACKEGIFDPEKADMWAAGVTLLQILYNEDPLQLFGLPSRLAARVERCDQTHFDSQLQRFYDGGNGSIWWIIKSLLDTNPNTRFTATEALEASCFQRLDKSQQERAFEELRRETFAHHRGIETSQVNLGDYGWVMQRVPEEERARVYSSEQNQQFYGYSLTPEFVLPGYQLTPESVTASSSSSSGYQLTP